MAKGKAAAATVKKEVTNSRKRKAAASESDEENSSDDGKKKTPKKKNNKRKAADSDDENNESDEEKSKKSEGSDNSDGEDKDSDEDEENNDGDDTKPAKKAEKKVVKKIKTESSSTKVAKSKVMHKAERLEEARKAFKWWEAPKLEKGVNWQTLEHSGIIFAPDYVPHNVPLVYDGKEVALNAEQEEVASFYAAIPADGPQLGNPKTAAVFQANFFEDFKDTLPPGHVIKKFKLCNFDRIKAHLDHAKSLKKASTTEEKLERKAAKDVATLKYGYCLIDGRIEKMGNYNMEPPGLFRGRGEHPKTGKLKSRCFSESVSLNLSEDAVVPICTLPGHAWQRVQHDPAVTWLCSWNENVQNQIKYVMLAASSSFKGKSDMDKYGKAIKLVSCIDKVRNAYASKINQTKDHAERQLGTAMWVIDKLALRVGGEKGEDEADTVGCCSLRVEHLKFIPAAASQPASEIELEFLGKDSMLYKQTIDFASENYAPLGLTVYKALKSFCDKKTPDMQVFETLSPPNLNDALSNLMPGLTAKVFRTYNASVTLETQLPSATSLEGLSIQDKVARYNAANREVAILCNHQKTVSKAAETMFETLHGKLDTLHAQKKELEDWHKLAKKGKADKIPLKEDDTAAVEALKLKIVKCTEKKEKAKTDEQRLDANEALEKAKLEAKVDQARRFTEKHFYKQAPTEASIAARIEKWEADIKKLDADVQNREDNKEVALGTSKINYMDPRISVAWCKRCEVPIDKVFAKTLRDKFNWAMAVSPDWQFK